MRRFMSRLRGLTEMLVLQFYSTLGSRLFSQRYFEYRYRRRIDPWSYETSPYEQKKYQQTLEILPQRPYRRILEVGCSIGVFTARLALAKIAGEIVAIDVAETALQRARRRLAAHPNVKLQRLDIRRDALAGTFDLIFCAEVLYYLGAENISIVRDKLVKALEEEGHLVLVHPWPLSRQLHERFFERPELLLVQEHVERDAERPYAITLYAKRSSTSHLTTQVRSI